MPNRLIWVLEQRETGIKRKNGKSKTVRKLLFSTAILAIAHLVSLKRDIIPETKLRNQSLFTITKARESGGSQTFEVPVVLLG